MKERIRFSNKAEPRYQYRQGDYKIKSFLRNCLCKTTVSEVAGLTHYLSVESSLAFFPAAFR